MKPLFTLRQSPAAKALAFLLCALSLTASACLGFVTLSNWDDLWLAGNYYMSSAAAEDMAPHTQQIYELAALRQTVEWGGKLSYSEQERLRTLEDSFSPEKTNFRYQLHDQAGALLLDNLDGQTLEAATPYQSSSHHTLSMGDDLHYNDYTMYADNLDDSGVELPAPIMMVYTGEENYVPCTSEQAMETYNQYGFLFDGSGWNYHADYDSRVRVREVVLEYGLADPMTAADIYAERMASFAQMEGTLPTVALLALLSLLGGLGLLVFLLRGAGWRVGGVLAPGWQEWIPYDLYLIGAFFLFAILLSAGEPLLYRAYSALNRPLVVGLIVFALGLVVLGIALVLTTVVRLKTHTLWRTSLIGRLCRGIWRFLLSIVRGLPAARKVVIFFLLYLLGTVLTGATLVLIPVYQGFVLWYLCRWVRQWKRIEAGIGRIAEGEGSYKIDTTGMFSDLRRHAEQLNDLGSAVNSAVAEQIRSERFKAELITNVSHDLKTPLTSIINYIGLLKALPTENPQAAEYLDVLDRKSQRLRRLTEDLVEASKASTGNLAVHLERLGMGQLLLQALGEYEEKFATARLEVVFHPPAEELYIRGDGRHLWRVIDNLFSNCAKYAMEGTRIYLELSRQDGNILLTAKNISRQALNLPPEQLMERFVRGEEARSTEGSGLGLSIARSLTELQQGYFQIDIDGDLFKVLVSLPEAPALTQGANTQADVLGDWTI